jgi:4,5-DOPA dioxygenase extradiol
MPALFAGHGSPLYAIEPNEFYPVLHALARRLPRPRAVLCVSAHWNAGGVALTASERPGLIHDFDGFPPELYAVRYSAPGDPALAARTAELLAQAQPRLDPGRGLDHGCWSVLRAMYPEADVPIVQLGFDPSQPAPFHYLLARQLAPLRREGVLVVGSGNLVHNLGLMEPGREDGFAWAVHANDGFKRAILLRDHDSLIAWAGMGDEARLAVPSPEHYLPLLYVVALQSDEDDVTLFNDRLVMGSLAMTSVVLGAAGA